VHVVHSLDEESILGCWLWVQLTNLNLNEGFSLALIEFFQLSNKTQFIYTVIILLVPIKYF
jgi:hypothetical protein